MFYARASGVAKGVGGLDCCQDGGPGREARAMKIKSTVIDIVSALVAYVGARWIFSGEAGVFDRLPAELATFAGLFLLLQLLIRGRKWARKGKA